MAPPEFRNYETHEDLSKIDDEEKRASVKSVEEDQGHTVDQALDILGFGRVNILMAIMVAVGVYGVTSETLGQVIIVAASECDLNMSTFQKGLAGASTYIGVMVPSFMWGYLTDVYGRRKITIYTLMLTSASSFCSSFAPTFLSFILFRFMTGFFVCAPIGSTISYLGEFNQVKRRTQVNSICCISAGLCMIMGPVVFWSLQSTDFRLEIWEGFFYRPWRLTIVIYSIPGFIMALMLMWFPESPKYYVARGRTDLALEVLQWVFVKNTGRPVNEFKVKRIQQENSEAMLTSNKGKGCWNSTKAIFSQVRPLFKIPYIFYLAITCYMQFTTFLAAAGLGMWFTYLSNQISKSSVTGTLCDVLRGVEKIPVHVSNSTVCDDKISIDAFYDSIMLGVYYTVVMSLIGLSVQRVGRGYILMVTFFGGGLAGYLLYWTTNPSVGIMLFSLLLVLPGSSLSLVSGSSVNLFPTSVRTTAICLALMCGRLATSVGSSVIGMAIETHCEATFFTVSTIVLVSGFLNFMLPWNIK